SGTSMREVFLTGLSNVLDTFPRCERFIYVSSTGIYGQTNGEPVDETSPTEPIEASGKVVLDAERLLLEKRPDAIVLRFAGMYGPNRLLRKKLLIDGEPLLGDADRLLNLIHIDDGVDAVLLTESRGTRGETYNIADDEPVTRRAFYTFLAELLHAAPARFDHHSEPGHAHRRVSNAKAKLALNWQPRYPSYRTGLPVAVKESKDEGSRR
ncbi:MAG TPA: NAD-dependent epimerase/dehydratase family protein, partial [Gemmata sp.]|nr:NAD-dependent epimerase/dehydratase family protein [Gemmata sp.]